MSAVGRIGWGPPRHSTHVDLLPVDFALRAMGASSPARVEACEAAADAMEAFVRDQVCSAQLVISDIAPGAWDAIQLPEVHAGRKREFVRTVVGKPILTIDYLREG